MSFAGIIRESINDLTGSCRSVFLCILVECNHEDNPNFLFNNKPIPLKRGDWIASVKRIEDLTGLTTKQVRTAIQKLQKLGKLKSSSVANRASLITIVNIDLHLHKKELGANQRQTEGQTKGKLRAINKNEKNEKNESKKNIQKKETEKFKIPDGIDENIWDNFEEMRKDKKKKLTDNSRKLIISQLKKINQETEQCPNDILNQSIMNCWTGVFPIKNNYTCANNKTKKSMTDQGVEYFTQQLQNGKLYTEEDLFKF